MNDMLSFLKLPDSEDTVLLLLCDVNSVDVLRSVPGLDFADLVLHPVFEKRPDLELPDSDLDEISDTSDISKLEDSSEMVDTLDLEVDLVAVDRAVVDLFFSRSGSCWIVTILEMERCKVKDDPEKKELVFTKL